METDDTNPMNDKQESDNDTGEKERLKDIDDEDDSFITYFERFSLRSSNDENCVARKIEVENGRMVEGNENSGERLSANWHLERLQDQYPLEVKNTLGDIAIESEGNGETYK